MPGAGFMSPEAGFAGSWGAPPSRAMSIELLLSSGSVQQGHLNGLHAEARRKAGREKDAEHWRVSSGSHCEHACCLKEAQEKRELVSINSYRDAEPTIVPAGFLHLLDAGLATSPDSSTGAIRSGR